MIYLPIREWFQTEILLFYFFSGKTRKKPSTFQTNVPVHNMVNSHCYLFWHSTSEMLEFLKKLENCSEFPISGTNTAWRKKCFHSAWPSADFIWKNCDWFLNKFSFFWVVLLCNNVSACLSKMNVIPCLNEIYFTLDKKSPVYFGWCKILFIEKWWVEKKNICSPFCPVLEFLELLSSGEKFRKSHLCVVW